MKPSRNPDVRRAKYSGKNTVKMTMNTAGLDRMIESLAGELEKAVRPAAQAAAQVLYDDVKKNIAQIGKVTGNLDRSIYQVFSQDNSNDRKATYHVSWNALKAPHGHLLEWGHIQRYQAYTNKAGEWKTMIRPEMIGKPKPKRKASQAEKDAYYVLRKDGPVQWVGKAFIRRAADKFPQAAAAAELELLRYMNEGPLKVGE